MENPHPLKNKNILITGASSGIGEACAHAFAAKGANLILCARRIERLKKLQKTLTQTPNITIQVIPLDVTEKNFEPLNEIDILINNAGLALGTDKIQNAITDDWDKMIDTNIKGLLYMTHRILPGMMKRNSGHIINIGSIASHSIYPGGAVYCASKHAVRAISQGLRMDLCGTKIRVSQIDPGMVETEFSLVCFKEDTESAKKIYTGFQPLRPEDISDAVIYCALAPAHVNIDDIVIMPVDQASVSMVSRNENH